MPRLIDADRTLEIVHNQGIAHPNAYYLTNYATLILREAPTVDAVEVVHGRWEWIGPYRYNDDGMIGTCSVCKERLRLFAYNYCPNCGAKMDASVE